MPLLDSRPISQYVLSRLHPGTRALIVVDVDSVVSRCKLLVSRGLSRQRWQECVVLKRIKSPTISVGVVRLTRSTLLNRSFAKHGRYIPTRAVREWRPDSKCILETHWNRCLSLIAKTIVRVFDRPENISTSNIRRDRGIYALTVDSSYVPCNRVSGRN